MNNCQACDYLHKIVVMILLFAKPMFAYLSVDFAYSLLYSKNNKKKGQVGKLIFEKKSHFMIIILCFAVCFSLFHVSLTDSATMPGSRELHSSAASTFIDDSTQNSMVDIQSQELVSSVFRAKSLFRSLFHEEQFKNSMYCTFGILFKIAIIPSFIFVVMRLSMYYQTSFQQLILEFIQNTDGKKKRRILNSERQK